MPTNWASSPDIPEGYDDWLIQYVITEVMVAVSKSPMADMQKLKELDSMAMALSREGGAAGQTAAS